MKSPIRVAITTGDADGIGTEITGKALASLGPQKDVLFYVWRSPRCPPKHLSRIDRKFKRIVVNNWPDALRAPIDSRRTIIDICSHLSPAAWVETSAKASFFNHIDAMTTGPLSKTAIAQAGFKDIGHTDILKRVSQCKNVFMAFAGDKFNVLLATAHQPTHQAIASLTTNNLEDAIRSAIEFRKHLPRPLDKRPIAVLGVNPHAGEEGMIGDHEIKVHLPIIKKLKEQGIDVDGPLVPDAAFLKENWRRYSVFVANYHDQGLIPFKMIHGQKSGVHLTMGLPFVRTSVDHGTAKSLFNKNKADASSMKLALEWAIRLTKSRKLGKGNPL